MSTEKSATSVVYEHLVNNMLDGQDFTSPQLAQALGVPVNRTSAALSGFAHAGLIKAVAKDGRSFIYRMDDRNANVRISEIPGPGNRPGYARGPNKPRGAVLARTISDKLLALAADVERMEADLTTVPTERLLGELTRRARAAAKEGASE